LRDAKGEKNMDAFQAAFINHVEDWKHCRMYLDGGAVNFDQQQHLVRKKEAAIPKNDAGLVASRSSCLAWLWRSLLPFAERKLLMNTENRSAVASMSRNTPGLLAFILSTRLVSARCML
jgi:hypothetical protein